MNKKITALTVTALASFALLGCNSDSDNDTESSNVNTGDTLILTANGKRWSHMFEQLKAYL